MDVKIRQASRVCFNALFDSHNRTETSNLKRNSQTLLPALSEKCVNPANLFSQWVLLYRLDALGFVV